MKIETLSTFPWMFDSVMNSSIMARAQSKGLLYFTAHDLRDYTHDKHRSTDDEPYGGGHGLVMKCDPIFEAYDAIVGNSGTKPLTIFLTPWGRRLDDALVDELTTQEHLFFICGHYEGIDERAYALSDLNISLGDYVLSSGELASMVVIDAVVRKIPGVLGNASSMLDESFENALLEYPSYTRPQCFRGMEVPAVLCSGNHAHIEQWRHEQRLERTFRLRPDLLEKARLGEKDYEFLKQLSAEGPKLFGANE